MFHDIATKHFKDRIMHSSTIRLTDSYSDDLVKEYNEKIRMEYRRAIVNGYIT
jgi:hypothetical protein